MTLTAALSLLLAGCWSFYLLLVAEDLCRSKRRERSHSAVCADGGESDE